MALCVSLDVDWAPDFVVEDLAELLAMHEVAVTVFCTHESAAVRALVAHPDRETGIHPNFLVDRNAEEVLAESLARFPAARGVRNHVLYYHSRLLPLFHQHGIEYFSNDLMFLHQDLAPFYDWSGLVRLPIYWQDDVHCAFFDRDFRPASLQLETPGMKVLNFHPIHVFLNTCNLDDYAAAKAFQSDKDALRARRNPGPGIRTLLCDLLASGALSTSCLLGSVARDFSVKNQYRGHYLHSSRRQA